MKHLKNVFKTLILCKKLFEVKSVFLIRFPERCPNKNGDHPQNWIGHQPIESSTNRAKPVVHSFVVEVKVP
jgi:hypothetical protein